MISCLILLDISWCSHGLVYKVWLGHLKGLPEVCSNALKGCLSLPGHLFPTGRSRKALLPPLALPLESFKDQLFVFVFPQPLPKSILVTAWGFDRIPFAEVIMKNTHRHARVTWLPVQYRFMDAKELTSQMKKDEAAVAEESFQYGQHLMLSTGSGRFGPLVV